VKSFKKINLFYYFCSFFLPVFILGVALAMFGVFPFGTKTILIQDMYSQYLQYFHYFYDVFYSEKSLFFSWSASMGMNFWGIYGYYLSSIFSPLVLFFDRHHLPEAILFLILFKIGLSGVTMFGYLSFYFKKIIKPDILLFSTCYALMSYSVIYFQNVMWLDGLIFLPVILLGLELILKENKPMLFSVSLTLMFFSNFYISYMLGIFVFLFFLVRYFTCFNKFVFKHFSVKFIQFSVGTLLAIGIAAINILPTYLALKESSTIPFEIPLVFGFTVNLLDLFSMFFNGAYDSIKYGLPNLYAGVILFFLVPLFFIKKNIPARNKYIYGLFIFLLFFSFGNYYLTLAWHAFDNPNWFPYRYSFVLSFLLIFISIMTFRHLDKTDTKNLILIYLISIFFIAILQKSSPEFMNTNSVALNIILLSGFLIAILYKIHFPDRKWVSLVFIFLLIIDLSTNAFSIIKNVDRELYVSPRTEHSQNTKYEKVFNEIQEKDIDFYRMESLITPYYNDAFRFDYKGIKHFSSMMNRDLVQSLNALGYTMLSSEKWISNHGTLFTDSIFGLKYLISPKLINKFGYTKVGSETDINIYKNEFALPLGFMVQDIEEQIESGKQNPFDLQNKNMNLMAGTKENKYFAPINQTDKKFINVKYDNGKLQKIDTTKEGKLVFNLQIKDKQQVYMIINSKVHTSTSHDQTEVLVNNTNFGMYPSTYSNRVLDVGQYNNEEISISLNLKGKEISFDELLVYGLDVDQFTEWHDVIKNQRVSNIQISENKLSGTVNSKDNGLLFTSIPWSDGWEVQVNGEKGKIKKVLGSFLAIEIEKGRNNLDLTFTPPGFEIGRFISAISLLLLLLLNIIKIIKKRKKIER
jgi:uncharacterized membrane protein YfhO